MPEAGSLPRTGEESPTTLHAQGVEQVGVADEDQREGWLVGQVEAQQQADLLDGRGGIVLRLVKDDHWRYRPKAAQGFLHAAKACSPMEAWLCAKPGEQAAEHPAGTQGGLCDDQRAVCLGIEGADPVGGQRAFARAVITAQEHHAAQGCALLEQFKCPCGLLGFKERLPRAFNEWHAVHAPLVHVAA